MHSKFVKRLVVCIFLLSILSSNGCMFQIAPLVKVPLAVNGYESYQVSIAVAPNGKIHIARTECPYGTYSECQLIYTTVMGGQVDNVYRIPTSAYFSNISDPDIAVTSSGVAYFIFRDYCNNDGNFYDYWMTSADLSVIRRLDHSYVSSGPPKIAAYGNYVYAVYQVPDGSYTRLRYKQLLGGASAGKVENQSSNHLIKPLSIAVNPSGHLYVLWGRENVSNSVYLASNYNTTGNMTVLVGGGSWSTGLNPKEMPLLVSQDGAWVYDTLIYPDYVNFSDHVYVDRWESTDFPDGVRVTVNLDPDKQWEILQPICMQVDQDKVYLAIVASNQDVTSPELYEYTYTFGSPINNPPIRITYNSETEGPPECAYYDDGDDAGFVVSWRKFDWSGYSTTYVWDPVHDIRTIPQVSTFGNNGFGMDGNGRFIAGIANVFTSSVLTPWVAYNAELVYLPLVRK